MLGVLKKEVMKHYLLTHYSGKIIRAVRTTNQKQSLLLHITKKCNLSCKYCYEKKYDQGQITTERIFQLIDEAKEIGIKDISFLGGEPFMHERFFDMLVRCFRNKQNIAIYTNGTLINDKWINLIKPMRNRCKIIFKMDSPEASKKTTGQSINKIVENNIQKCVNNGIRSYSFIAVTKLNYKEISNITRRSLELGALPEIERYIPTGSGYDSSFEINRNDFMYALRAFCDEVAKHFGEPRERFYKKIKNISMIKSKFCSCCGSVISVGTNGDVTHCPMEGSKYSEGNVNHDTLKTIIEKMKRQSTKMNNIPNECKGCQHSTYCRGGCKVFTVHKTGSYKKDPFCMNSNIFMASRLAYMEYYKLTG